MCKRKREVMEEYDSNSNPESKRVRRVTANDEINELCYKWFCDATSRKVNVKLETGIPVQAEENH